MTTTTSVNQNIQTLEQLCVVHADFDIWSGKARLEPADIKLGDGGRIPPEKLTSLGSKKICDPADINAFHALKTQTRRLLSHYGLRFMSGYAVPASKLPYIQSELDIIKQQFDDARQQFLDNYDASVNKWVADNPEFAESIRRGIMPVDVVAERIGLEYTIYNINPASEASALQLARQVDSLTTDLYAEIEQEANSFYDRYLRGASHLNASTKASLEKLCDKIDGLSFMNADLDPLANLLRETITGIEKNKVKNRIEAPYLFQVMSVILICADKEKIRGYASGTVIVEVAGSGYQSIASDDDDEVPMPTQTPQLFEDTQSDDAPATRDAQSPDRDVVSEDGNSAPETPDDDGLSGDLLGDLDAFFAGFTSDSATLSTTTQIEVKSASPAPSPVEPEPAEQATEALADVDATPAVAEAPVSTPVQPSEPMATPVSSLADTLSAMGAMPTMEESDGMADMGELPVPVFADDDEDDCW